MTQKHLKKAKNIRFPNDLLQQIETLCEQQGCSFSFFVEQAVKQALTDLHTEGNTP